MKQIVASILADMVEHEQGQPKHIQHFLKVHAFARYICLLYTSDAADE